MVRKNKKQTQIQTNKMEQKSVPGSCESSGFPGGASGKEPTSNVGDLGSIPGLGRSPGGGYGNPLQYCCLENPMDRGAWWARVHGVTKNRTRLSDEAQHNQRV